MILQTELAVGVGGITRAQEYFNEPDIFKPGRWLDSDSKDVKEASQPFLLGRRSCIGKK